MSEFTDEDRQNVLDLCTDIEDDARAGKVPGPYGRVESVRGALAYIDHLERLQRADAMPTITLTRDEAWQIREGLFAEPGGLVPVEAMDLLLDKLNAILEPASKGEDE